MSSPPTSKAAGIDWAQWFYPGPRRVFTADEMARAGDQPWPSGIDHYLYVNVILLLAIFNQYHHPWLWPVGLGLAWATLAIAQWLWKAPTRPRLNLASYGVAITVAAVSIVMTAKGGRDAVQGLLPLVLAVLTAVLSGWWVLTLYRADQIEARLRELADQDAAMRLSTRLAAAQIQPHFLFNTLASLQHWVDTGDTRAAPLLRDFTAYLRATLPMFERELQPLADEIEMVRRYLAIMQARLGARLTFAIDVSAELPAQVPPGIVLTLVENAIAHGIEPQLRGGQVTVAAHRAGHQLVLTVRDDGAGLSPGCADGVGLANSRRRLVNANPNATLTLTHADPGCVATLTLPLA
jgi:hypothetical protein